MYANEKERFEEVSGKQIKRTKKLLFIIFGVIGLTFLVLGLIFHFVGLEDENGQLMSLIFMPMGGFWILLAVVLYFVLPNKFNYDRYQRRVNRWGLTSSTDLLTTVELQQEKINELEKRVDILEGRVRP